MPELPEVETICHGVTPWILRYTILYTEVRKTKLRWPVDKKIILLQNQLVLSVQRRAKYLILKLEEGYILIHFGLSGKLSVVNKVKPLEKHDHIDLIINNGCVIRYTDPRCLGAWLWINNLNTCKLLSNLGLEPLSNEFNGDWLYHQSRNKSSTIKTLLMTNKIVVGIGNVYANESLFIAKILPMRIACSLNKKETEILSRSIKMILKQAIKLGGTTLRDFRQPNNNIGYFIYKLQVYGRNGKSCYICKNSIQMIKQNCRSTFFCINCQK